MMKSNCLIFAIKRLWHKGGYVIFRKSSYGWWPHVLWSSDLMEFEEFTTDDKFNHACPPILFLGFINKFIPTK